MRYLGWTLLVILILLLALPTIVSSFGTAIAEKLSPNLKVDSISLNWLSPQVLEGISFQKEGSDARIKKIVLEKSLLSILFSLKDWGLLTITDPEIKTSLSSVKREESNEKSKVFIPPISELKIENGTIAVDGVSVSHLVANVRREEGLTRLPFTLSALSSTAEGEGKIKAEGVLLGPDHHFKPQTLHLDIDRFPLATVDSLIEEPFLVKAFGPTLSVQGQIEENAYSLQVKGERIEGGGTSKFTFQWKPEASFIPGLKELKLQLDSQTIDWSLDATLTDSLSFLGPRLLIEGKGNRIDVSAEALKISPIFLDFGKTISLQKPVKGELYRLPTPYKILKNLTLEIKNGSIRNKLSSLSIDGSIQGGVETEDLKLPSFQFDFSKGEGCALCLDGETLVSHKDRALFAILGGEGKVAFFSEGYPRDETLWEFDPFSFAANFPLLQADGYLSLTTDGKIETPQPLVIHYLLTKEIQENLLPTLPPLEQSAKLLFEASLTTPLYIDRLETWNFQTTVSTPFLKFDAFALTNMIGSVDVNGAKGVLLTTLEGKTQGKTFFGGRINLDLRLNRWRDGNEVNLDKAEHELTLHLEDFPSALLPEGKSFFGDRLSVEISSNGNLDIANGTAKIDSSGSRGKLAWRWDEKTIALSTPSFTLLVPPALYEPLLEPLPVVLEIDNLTIPRDSPLEGSGKGTLDIASATLLTPQNGRKIKLPSLQGIWSLDKTGAHFNVQASNGGLSLNGNVRVRTPLPETLKLTDFSISLLARGTDLPSSLLTLIPNLARLEPIVHPLFSVDLDLKLNQGNGSINTSLISTNGTFLLDGIFQEGWLFLNKNLEVSLQMTPEIASGILGELVPLISSGVRGRSPIRVAIDARGFQVPLSPFDLSLLDIGNGVVELDQIDVNPTRELGELLSLLGAKPTPGKPEMLWFTPLYFSLKNGVASLKRVDILVAEKFPVALWGKVDLVKELINLEIGLGARTLEQAFGLKGLPKDYILPVPLKGTFESASIDKPKATAKVGALLAQLQGSPQGLVIGGVLDLISGGLTESGVPQPTTKPIPWETEEEQKQREERPHTPLKKIFKGAENGVKSLLKKIF